jgi:hypothetical protein
MMIPPDNKQSIIVLMWRGLGFSGCTCNNMRKVTLKKEDGLVPSSLVCNPRFKKLLAQQIVTICYASTSKSIAPLSL